MARKAEPAIPLAFRVPNPPPTFVGREPELRAIRAAARRGAVVVAGLGGLGKTALVLAALKKHFPTRLRAAVLVGLRPQPLQQTLVEILRALGALAGRRDDWSALAGEADLLALALDLAEEHDAVVVLDDLHHGGVEVLVAAARYARRSLWIATSRVAPDAPELVGQIVTLGPLPDGKLAALARLLLPRSPSAAVRDAVRHAAGSPFRLRRALVTEGDERSPLEELTPASIAILETLGASELTVDAASLSRLADVPDVDATLGELARRGLVEVRAGGVRLHDVAAPSIAERLGPDAKARVARALAASPGEALALEGLRLFLALGDEGSARALLEARGRAMLRAGYAPTLWAMLAARGDGWDAWKLRVALQVATVDVTRALSRPRAQALEDRVLWIRGLLVGGRLDEAAREAADVVGSASGAVAFWAGLLGAMAVHHGRNAEEGLAAIRRLAPPDPPAATLRDVVAAFWLAECGDPDGALALLAQARGDGESDVEVLGAPTAFFTRYYRMAALMECGHLDDAHAAMLRGAPEDMGEELSAARVAGNALANLALARGHLAEARARLDRIARSPSPAGLADVTALLVLEHRIAAGELGGVEADVERLAQATRERTPLVHAWCTETRERVHALFARPLDEAPLDLASLPLGPGTRGIVTLRRAIREVRHGGSPRLGAPPRDVEGAILHAMASREPARAIELAAAHGWAIRELEARAMLVELRLGAGEDAAADARAFGERARAIGSARFVLEAELLELVAESQGGSASGPRRDELAAPRLEALADAIDVSPVAARRARAILGADAPLDALDAAVVRAARLSVKVVGDAPQGRAWRRGWGLDLDKKVLWREDGTTASLARHALYVRILESLSSRGGAATFEDLARDAWNVRSFHPLHDGNRLRVTMHRIRSVVGSERIVLRDAGYALAGPPFRVISSA